MHQARRQNVEIRNGQDYMDPAQFGPVTQILKSMVLVVSQPPGDTCISTTNLRRAPKGQTDSCNDYRELAYIVSGEVDQ